MNRAPSLRSIVNPAIFPVPHAGLRDGLREAVLAKTSRL
jgi:hypothetical protein